MKHFSIKDNIGLIIGRQGQVVGSMQWNLSFITKNITDFNMYYRGGGVIFPLFLTDEHEKQDSIQPRDKAVPNFDYEIIAQFKVAASGDDINPDFAPIDVIDYIYAILHSPTYRERYKEFLKIDFPKIPYPKDQDTFLALVKLGKAIREIHLLESSTLEEFISTYPHSGNNTVTRKIVVKDWELYDLESQLGRIWINDKQCFDQIPLIAWEFYIGGYQPAQKWLKDRKERTLSFDDILHYQKIIVALNETHRIMQEIDDIDFE